MFRELDCRGVSASVGVGVAVVCVALLGASAASAAVIHVYEGESIQRAIDDAITDDQIIVHPGTYYEDIDFLGKAIWLRSSDGAWLTTIHGSESVVRCTSGEGTHTRLDGFTITGGAGSEHQSRIVGGGMLCLGGSSPDVFYCTFVANTAQFGGGMYTEGGSPYIFGCRFYDNSCWSEDEGGGVYAGGRGAGIFAMGGSPWVRYCIFKNGVCDATDHGADGGGISASDGCTAYVEGCSFVNNRVYPHGYGGGINAHDANIIDCKFVDNVAEDGDGGGAAVSGNSIVANCLFVNNSAGAGGGVALDSDAAFANSTVQGNNGGGIHAWGNPKVANCIVWSNLDYQIGGSPIVTYSNIQDGYGGVGNIDADPLFVDPDNGGYHLSCGSPCIDAGDNTAVPDGVTADLADRPRFVDDPDTDDTGIGYPCVDMGAYEFQVPGCRADVNGDGVVDIDDLFAVLAHWGEGVGIYDVNYDGIVDIDDIFAILADWGPCG